MKDMLKNIMKMDE